jgi:hypothetical protein
MSLQDFIETNRGKLLSLTRGKVAKRTGLARSSDAEEQNGVPVLLGQLCQALVKEARQSPAQQAPPDPPTNPNIEESATSRGRDMLGLGLSIDEVVHGYGDVCQAVTELAVDLNEPITVAEFHTLNRCLDNAIASAVSAWSKERETDLSATGGQGRGSVNERLRSLLTDAIVVFDLLQGGKIAAGGSSGKMLGRSLAEMRALLDTTLPELRLGAGAPASHRANGNGAGA